MKPLVEKKIIRCKACYKKLATEYKTSKVVTLWASPVLFIDQAVVLHCAICGHETAWSPFGRTNSEKGKMMTLTYLTQDDLAALRLAHADLIAQHNQAAAAVRAGLVELHDQLVKLKGLQAEIYNLEKPQAAAIVASLDNPMSTLASVHNNLTSLANQAGYKFPEWETEFMRGAKNGE